MSTKISNSLAIRPYVDQSVDNMGLEKYNMSLFEGIFHEEPLACVEQYGVKRYLTGLNEFAPEIKELPDEEREAAIKEIRIMVSQLESELAANKVDPEDPEFWNKIKMLSPSNDSFWSSIYLRVGNDPIFLFPATNPHDLIKVKAIENGGFSSIAKNFETARTSSIIPKFYLDRAEETAGIRTEVKKLRNKAGGELDKLFSKNLNKLFLVCKVVDQNSIQYKKSTPNDIMYENMDKYIMGETVETNKKKTAERFIEIAGFDMETLKIRAMIKDATFYKVIALRGDGLIYHSASSTIMGRNPSEIVEFLKNPLNENILSDITKTIEKYWMN